MATSLTKDPRMDIQEHRIVDEKRMETPFGAVYVSGYHYPKGSSHVLHFFGAKEPLRRDDAVAQYGASCFIGSMHPFERLPKETPQYVADEIAWRLYVRQSAADVMPMPAGHAQLHRDYGREVRDDTGSW